MFLFTAVLCAAVALFFVVLACRDQRELWWRVAARRYRNPEAVEPSDGALAGQRVSFLVLAALFGFGAFQLWGSADEFGLSDGEVQSIARDAARELSPDPLDGAEKKIPDQVSDDGFEEYVAGAVRSAARESGNRGDVNVTASSSNPEKDPYGSEKEKKGEKSVLHYAVSGAGHSACITLTTVNAGEYGATAPVPGDDAPSDAGPTTYEYKLSARASKGQCEAA
ncbi:hypothetical protein [Streptomyces sp. ODS28]|uniref:hypothetical protein n=1 Tax=Streptomyces sp. ODS28 TaxID=3136688 RepID=UPI0031E8CE79